MKSTGSPVALPPSATWSLMPPPPMTSGMFEGFQRRRLPGADGVEINAVVGGSGPPLLLLHGYPQTHVMWNKVAPTLAERFTVVATDLRGYGDSSKPDSDPAHLVYSKRSTANDQVAAMRALGFERFFVAGHDRGGRVAHRMALDHPGAVRALAVLDIAPTREMFKPTSFEFAMAYYHWFFLAQPFDLPERLIGADPEYYLRRKTMAWSGGHEDVFGPEALAEYIRCFKDPKTIHASCEDYGAASCTVSSIRSRCGAPGPKTCAASRCPPRITFRRKHPTPRHRA